MIRSVIQWQRCVRWGECKGVSFIKMFLVVFVILLLLSVLVLSQQSSVVPISPAASPVASSASEKTAPEQIGQKVSVAIFGAFILSVVFIAGVIIKHWFFSAERKMTLATYRNRFAQTYYQKSYANLTSNERSRVNRNANVEANQEARMAVMARRAVR